MEEQEIRDSLLAVDLGVRTGLALFGGDGRLRWYRSQNFGTRARLKRALPGLLAEVNPKWVVLEGGGDLAALWTHAAETRGAAVLLVQAHDWRPRLLLPREQRNGEQAKAHADTMARRVIEWSGAARPTSLRHDAAEAILAGLWGMLEVGRLTALPEPLRR